ncbi:spherulin-2A [Helicoverpa armigera]|uniref:spherulin-2A n=1 Tax=Helicoverpa armigera TaxID=29058 RepID=UPI00308348FA
MGLKLLVLVLIIKQVVARIQINAIVDEHKQVHVTYNGIELHLISDEDIRSFHLEDENLIEAVTKHLGQRPKDIYLKSPTPWGDLYKTYKWETVKREMSIKSVRVTGISKDPVVVLSQDFENISSNKTIKVNTGISHTIENTITTSWTKSKEFTVSQEIEYEFNVGFAKAAGTTGFSFTSNWGVSEEITKTDTIGTTSGMETELKPGQAVTAVLSAKAGFLELEVVHKASLRGNVAVNFRRKHAGHHFWGPTIQDVMRTGGISNEIITIETIRFGFHVEGSLKVYDKETGEAV